MRERRGVLSGLAVAACGFALVLWPAGARAASSVYVTNSGAGTVSQYDIGAGGALAPKRSATIAAGGTPFAVAVSPHGRSFYVPNNASNDLNQYDVGASGALAPKANATISAGAGPQGVAVSPDGKSLYVTNFDANDVSQYDIGADGAVNPKTGATIPAGKGPVQVALTPDGRSVYVTNETSNDVSQYDVGAGGALAPKATPAVAAGRAPFAMSVSPDGRSVYVTNLFADAVSQYDVGAGGALAPKASATIATGAYPDGIAVSPDGDSVYVTNNNSSTVSQYNVAAGGMLAAKASAIATGAGPVGVAVSPDGTSVYVANFAANSVSQYDVLAGGALVAKASATVAAGKAPLALVVLPDQGPAAAFASALAPAGSASRFDGSASSDPDGRVTRFDWNFGDGHIATDAGPAPTHSYAAGTYTATLTVTDDAGCSSVFVFTGQSASCAGGPAASTARTITIRQGSGSQPHGSAPAAGRRCVVPKLKGRTVAEAKRALHHAHCALGASTRRHSRQVRKGRVIAQRAKPGSVLAAGAKVKITLSRGP